MQAVEIAAGNQELSSRTEAQASSLEETAASMEHITRTVKQSAASASASLRLAGEGHAPQGVQEQNYIRRPLDLLRLHHEEIEAWIFEQDGVAFDAKAAAPAGLLVVA